MKAAEFLRRVRKAARKKNIPCRFVPDRGKGSHGMLFYGNRRTTLKDLKKEIGESLLHDMCRQLGINKGDLF